MRSFRLVSPLCLLLAAACGNKGESAAPEAEPRVAVERIVLGRLVTRTGEVRLERDGVPSPAAPGPLSRGDAQETGADGDVLVRFTNGRVVEVGPGSRVLLEEDGAGGVVAVSSGGVMSREDSGREAKEGGSALTLLTPYGLARLGTAGDQAKVDVGPDAGHVEVLEGSVEVVAKNGRSARAAKGQLASLTGTGVTVGSMEAVPTAMKVLSASGQVDWRKADTESWRSVEGEEEALKGGGMVRVGRGEVVLQLAGGESTLELGPGGELMVVGADQRGALDEARLDLVQGELRLLLVPGRASRVVLPRLFLEAPNGAAVDVRRLEEGYAVAARLGEVVLVRGSLREPLRAGERATVEGEEPADIQPLERAPLALGPAENQKVLHQRLREVALVWADEGEVRVEVASDAQFKERVLSGVARRGFVNVAAPATGALHWWVRRLDGEDVARGSASFEPERTKPESGKGRNRAPALVVKIPRDGQRGGPRVRVSGTAPEDAKLFVNGQPVALDARHRFDTRVDAQGPSPLVVLKMSRPGSPDVYTVRVLK